MGHPLETTYSGQLSKLPHMVRVPVPQERVTWSLETMHYWATEKDGSGYAASPFRDFSDPWQPWGSFIWYFRSRDVASQFAAQFSGKLITRR